MAKTGTVYLTGAGPGDPGLLTLRALEVLQKADLVLYDGLANPVLLRHTNGICERTARTRIDSRAIVPQEEVNQRLVDEAKSGKCVVRLKGGDPYIFGRGSEEAAALEAAGIPYEVVPGITAATAAAEYAGFSYTHRSHTSAVAFVTGHEDPTKDESRLDYAALAAFPGTLVFYMGLGQLSQICQRLIENGQSSSTPAAIVCRASLPTQQIVQSTLKDLPQAASAAGLKPPSLIVVGECVNLRQVDSWFERRWLHGLKIGVTCAEHQIDDPMHEIVIRSGQPVPMPLLEVSPVSSTDGMLIQKQLNDLKRFQWLVFTSRNGVSEFFQHLNQAGLDSRALGHMQIATVGPSTAESLKNYGITADVVPQIYSAEALVDELANQISGQAVLWARASRGRDTVAEGLLNAGATEVVSLVVYQNDDAAALPDGTMQQIKSGQLDWICLSSPAAAKRLSGLLKAAGIDPNLAPFQIATISSLTTEAAVQAELTVKITATEHTWTGMLDAIGQHQQTARQRESAT